MLFSMLNAKKFLLTIFVQKMKWGDVTLASVLRRQYHNEAVEKIFSDWKLHLTFIAINFVELKSTESQ